MDECEPRVIGNIDFEIPERAGKIGGDGSTFKEEHPKVPKQIWSEPTDVPFRKKDIPQWVHRAAHAAVEARKLAKRIAEKSRPKESIRIYPHDTFICEIGGASGGAEKQLAKHAVEIRWVDLCRDVCHNYDGILKGSVALENRHSASSQTAIRSIAENGDAKNIIGVYNGIASIAHPICRSSTCVHENNLGVLSDAIASIQAQIMVPRVDNAFTNSGSMGIKTESDTDSCSISSGDYSDEDVQQGGGDIPVKEESGSQPPSSGSAVATTSTDSNVCVKNAGAVADVEECGTEGGSGQQATCGNGIVAGSKIGIDRTSHCDSHASDKTRVECSGPVEPNEGNVVENVQLHEVWQDKLVGQGGLDKLTEVTIPGVDIAGASVFSTYTQTEHENVQGQVELCYALGVPTTRGLQPEQAVDIEGPVARPSVGSSDTQQLCAQRGAVIESEGASLDPTNGDWSDEVDATIDSKVSTVDAGCPSIFGLGQLDLCFSAEQETTLSKGGTVSGERTFGTSRCKYEVVYQIRKIADIPEGWGSKDDPSSNTAIQSGVWKVHKGNRKSPILNKRPSTDSKRGGHSIDSKGKKFRPEGARPKGPLGSDGKSSIVVTGSESVGYACGGKLIKNNASTLSGDDKVPSIGGPTEVPALQQGKDGKWRAIQGSSMCHEWRYDNGSRQLCCDSCHIDAVPFRFRVGCYKQRLRWARNQPKSPESGTPSSRVVRYNGKRKVNAPAANGVLYRRGRSCDDSGKGDSGNCDKGIAPVLVCNGTQPQGGGSSGEIPRDPILPTQATKNPRKVDNGAGSQKSVGNINTGTKPVPEGQDSDISGHSLGSQMAAALRSADFRAILLEVIKESSVGVTNECGRETESPGGTGLPVAPKNNKECAKSSGGNNTGNAGNVLRPMGYKPRFADVVRKPRNRPAEGAIPKTPSVERRRVGSGRDMRLDHVIFEKGDVLDCREYTAVHAVGADLTMGAGVAKQFAKIHGRPAPSKKPRVGDFIAQQSGNLRIIHAVTKPESRRPAAEQKDAYSIFKTVMSEVAEYVSQKEKYIAIPDLIGCGLDKMSRGKVLEILESIGKQYNVTFVAYNYVFDKSH